MNLNKRVAALLAALMLALTLSLPALAETATQPPVTDAPMTVAEEPAPGAAAAPQETASPSPEAASPAPTMALTDKDQMPKPNPEAKDEAIVTSSEGASLFELPAMESGILSSLDAGSVLTLNLLGQTWSKVTAQGVSGFVPTYKLSFAFGASQPAIVIATAPLGKLTQREEMTTKSRAVTVMKSGRAALMLAKGELFSLVRYEGKEGYVLTAHLKEVAPNTDLGQYYQVISLHEKREANVRLRAEGKRDGAVYTTVKSGNGLVVLDYGEEWSQVEFEGFHGFMMTDYLKKPM